MTKKMKVCYVIPDQLPDLYVNGAWGGLLGNGMIQMHLYSERQPIPKELTLEVDEQGQIVSDPEGVEKGGDIVRLFQASIIMDAGVAISIRDWLDTKIEAARAAGFLDKNSDRESK